MAMTSTWCGPGRELCTLLAHPYLLCSTGPSRAPAPTAEAVPCNRDTVQCRSPWCAAGGASQPLSGHRHACAGLNGMSSRELHQCGACRVTEAPTILRRFAGVVEGCSAGCCRSRDGRAAISRSSDQEMACRHSQRSLCRCSS